MYHLHIKCITLEWNAVAGPDASHLLVSLSYE